VNNQVNHGGLQGSGILGIDQSSHFIKDLHADGSIDQSMLGLHIDLAGGSKIQWGGYDTKYAQEPITWFSTSMGYEKMFRNVMVGDKKWTVTRSMILFDTGASMSVLPIDDLMNLKEQFLSDFTCTEGKLFSCDCTEQSHQSVPDITFGVIIYGTDTKNFVIHRDMWFERRGSKCYIKFMHSVKP
jgi:hypothetical protein